MNPRPLPSFFISSIVASLAFFVAVPAAYGFWGSSAPPPSGRSNSSRDYVTNVEGIGGKDMPLYRDGHSAAEQRKVFEMGQLAAESYKDGTAAIPDGYTAVTTDNGLKDVLGQNSQFKMCKDGSIEWNGPGINAGFQAAIYKSEDGSLVLAFRGTEGTSLFDWNTDIEQASGKSIPDQYRYAALLLRELLAANPGVHIDVTGHSLGGGLTQYAMAKNDLGGRVSGYTYNSAGLSDNTLRDCDDDRARAAAGAMTNVRNRGDTVSSGAGYHLGEVYDYDNPRFKAHGIGEVIGNDSDGYPIYDGFLGNIQRDLAVAEGKNPPDYLAMDDDGLLNASSAARRAAREALSAVSSSSGTVVCPCDNSVAKRKELEDLIAKQKKAEEDFITRKRQKESAMWKLVADICKPLPKLAAKIAGDAFGSLGESAVNVFNEAFEDYLNGKLDMVKLAKKVISEIQNVLEDEIEDEVKRAAKESGSPWYSWILHPIDTITGVAKKWVDILEEAYNIGATIGGDLAFVVAYRGDYRDAKQKLADLTAKIDAARKELESNGGCYCAQVELPEWLKPPSERYMSKAPCQCPHCKKEETAPGDGTGDGTGGSGGGTGGSGGGEEEDVFAWLHTGKGDPEDPWKPIHEGITGENAPDGGGSGLLDIVGMGDFSRMLDTLSDIAALVGDATTVSQLAGGIWGVASGGSGIVDSLMAIANDVANGLNQLINSAITKATGWISTRLDEIAEAIDKVTGPANEWLDNVGSKINELFAVSVKDWIQKMVEYAESIETTRVSSPRLTVVDYGIDTEIKVDTSGSSQRARKIRPAYSEDVR